METFWFWLVLAFLTCFVMEASKGMIVRRRAETTVAGAGLCSSAEVGFVFLSS